MSHVHLLDGAEEVGMLIKDRFHPARRSLDARRTPIIAEIAAHDRLKRAVF